MKAISDAEWLERVISEPSGCWSLPNRIHRTGYVLLNRRSKSLQAHRLIYELFHGPIPSGLTLDHLCRNRACVNPAHLEPVSLAENIRRAFRLRTHCKHGHAFTQANIKWTKEGQRHCRECHRLDSRRRHALRRQQETTS